MILMVWLPLKKIQHLKSVIRKWNHSIWSLHKGEKYNLNKLITTTELLVVQGVDSKDDMLIRHDLLKTFAKMLNYEAKYLTQKSKVK